LRAVGTLYGLPYSKKIENEIEGTAFGGISDRLLRSSACSGRSDRGFAKQKSPLMGS